MRYDYDDPERAAATARQWQHFLIEHPLPWCWACGCGQRDRPDWWHVPWLIERSHIVNKPRRDDRRLAVLLCSGCHKTSHGERIVGWTLPRLKLQHLLWLKAKRDPQFYNRTVLRDCIVGIYLPKAVRIPAVFLEQYASRRG